MPDVSIIIVNWNTRDLLCDCINSALRTTAPLNIEVIVVDNASSDGSVAMLRGQFPFVKVIANSKNVGFARANNQGAAASCASCHSPGNGVNEASPAVGLVGAQLRNPDGSFQASFTPFPGLWQEFLILSSLGRRLYGQWYPSRGPQACKETSIVDYVEGACMLVRREAYQAVDGLDEAYFMYAEDVEICYALRQKGWQVRYQPAALVVHLGGGSSQSRRPDREGDLYCSRVRFFRRHYGAAAALALTAQILAFTAIKTLAHTFLRLISHGRYGRPVVPLSRLAVQLRRV